MVPKARISSRYTKPVSYAGLFLICGVMFLILSRIVVSITEKPATNPLAASTRPAEASEDGPAPGSEDEGPRPARDPAVSLSGILLMFSVACFLLTGVCVGWIVQVYRKSRPAWKTQTRYPPHRSH